MAVRAGCASSLAQHSGDVRELVEALWWMRERLLAPDRPSENPPPSLGTDR